MRLEWKWTAIHHSSMPSNEAFKARERKREFVYLKARTGELVSDLRLQDLDQIRSFGFGFDCLATIAHQFE